MVETDRVLNVQEVADRLRIGPHTIRRWLREGKIKGTLMGSDRAGWRIFESEVERVLREGPRQV